MIIYNKTWLNNRRLQDQLEKDTQEGRITADELTVIRAKYPVGFYTPNIAVRVGLFILTVIIVSFAIALLSLMFESSGIVNSFGWVLFLGVANYICLEFIVRTNHHLRSGVDDALLFITACLLIAGFFILIDKIADGTAEHLALSLIIFVITLFLSLRFADLLISGACIISFFAVIFFTWIMIVPSGLLTAPFIMMGVSGGTYYLTHAYAKREKLVNYKSGLYLIETISLLTFYAAGNYYIIQTLGNEMKGIDSNTNTAVPFGIFFWLWTILLPFVYLTFGIRKKDTILLRTGLALIAVAVLTFRNYYHLLPLDVMLTIGGIVVLGIIYGVTSYLKIPKHGFTREDISGTDASDSLKLESLIIAQTFSHTPQGPTDDGIKFGGGDFGGGGSSSSF